MLVVLAFIYAASAVQPDCRKTQHQFVRDVDAEKSWINAHRDFARDRQLGKDLTDCHRLQKEAQSRRNEVDAHEPRIDQLLYRGEELIEESAEHTALFEMYVESLRKHWQELKDLLDARRIMLEESEKAHQFLAECNKAEAWMREKELHR